MKGKGLIKKEVEDLQLESMQGVHGLKTLRVTVNFDKKVSDTTLGAANLKGVLKSVTKSVS